MKKWMFVYAILAISFPIFTNPAIAGTPSISGLSNFGFTEQDAAAVIDNDVSFSGGGSYSGGYLEFELASGTNGDTLALEEDGSASTVDGQLSIVDGTVYLGDGSNAAVIGSVDSTYDGQNGQTLRINFSNEFENGNFETGVNGDTVITGWTAVKEQIHLNGTDQIAGQNTAMDTTWPTSNGTIHDEVTWSSDPSRSVYLEDEYQTGGDLAIRMNTGQIYINEGYGVLRGPYVYSNGTVSLQQGDTISFDWKALSGGDAYDAYGYIIDVNTGNTITILDQTGTSANQETDWATVTITIGNGEDGSYRFVFVAGSYDFTGFRLVGGELMIDDIIVTQANAPSTVGDAIISEIARRVNFENTSDDPPDTARTLTVTAGAEDSSTGSATSTITITPVNDDPTDISLSNTEIDAAGGINSVVGLLSSSDPDSSSFSYSLVAGAGDTDNGSFNISGSNLRAYDADMAGGSYQIRIESNDGAGGTFEKRFTLTVADADGDGISDVREGTDDTDGDGTPDYQDTDSDGDGIDDVDEGTDDTDGDGTPDYQDTDSDGDGIDDVDEGTDDTDGDGTPDYQDTDSDGDGINDSDESANDTDGDGTPDYQDTDSDGDGINDSDESANDTDGDGTPDYNDTDSDGDGINDSDESADDTDGDGTPDYQDTDSDGDGIEDVDEGADDTDGDGTPDYQDTDSDGDGITDEVEGNTDTDSDGTPDFQDTESDGDGVGDEIENGAANDGDGNNDSTPDRLQARVTTLMTYDEAEYVTMETPEGTTLTDVVAIDNPSPDDMPAGSTLTHGMYDFTINNMEVGGSVTLTLYLPADARPDSYLKYGPTPDDETDHWYEFVYDGVTGAEINDNVITLHFVDGDEGDDVLTADGMIFDAGGPMADSGVVPDSDDYGPANGCFIDSLTAGGSIGNRFNAVVAAALASLLALSFILRRKAVRQIFVAVGLIGALILGVPETGTAQDEATGASDAFARFYLNAGIGVAYIDESIGADYQGQHYEMKVDNDIYPVLRAGYAFSDNLALELGFRWDIYSGEMDRSGAGGSGSPKGYTFLLGPVYTFDEYQCKVLGPLKPMVHLDLGYTLLHDDPDYPVSDFDPAFGVDIAVGVQRKAVDLRLGYRYFELDGGDLQDGTTNADGSLNLSGVYMEVSYRFNFGM